MKCGEIPLPERDYRKDFLHIDHPFLLNKYLKMTNIPHYCSVCYPKRIMISKEAVQDHISFENVMRPGSHFRARAIPYKPVLQNPPAQVSLAGISKPIEKHRKNPTPEQREAHLTRQQERYKNLTSEQREARRTQQRERYANQTREQKEKHLRKKRERYQNQPSEQREARLKQRRERYANQPSEQREARLKQMRDYINKKKTSDDI